MKCVINFVEVKIGVKLEVKIGVKLVFFFQTSLQLQCKAYLTCRLNTYALSIIVDFD